MKTQVLTSSLLLSAIVFCGRPAAAANTDNPPVLSTPPVTLEDKLAMYNATVEDRAQRIMAGLGVTDAAKSNHVHNAIVAHYHALRARDEAIDDELGDAIRGSAEWKAQRVAMFPQMSQPLHDKFVAVLSQNLTPEQLDLVKDKMTYGKVQFTYNAYCSIVPNLTDEDKSKILDLLKQAREVAIDGGSADEKTAIFQEYKDQINAYLATRGHDVAKEIQDWSDKQKATTNNPSAIK